MNKSFDNRLHITEGIGGAWFHHLSETNTNATALCGARTMNTSIPLARWGLRGHLNEGWCAECAAQGDDVLREAGVSLANLSPSANLPDQFDPDESYPAERPPLESGSYVVLRANGQSQESNWNGDGWDDVTDVVRYCGKPAKISDEGRQQHRQNIRAGLEAPVGSEQRNIAQKSAIALARHSAVKMSQSRNGDRQRLAVKNMVGYFMVARTLGISFSTQNSAEVTETDKALFAWGTEHIRALDPDWFVRAGSRVESVAEIRMWLDQL